jgi:hypothetical protein
MGCDSGPPTDDTPNQMVQSSNYPPGPYGYVQGSVIENIQFLGKNADDNVNAPSYSQMMMQPVQLADYHNDSSTKYVVLSGVAGWCSPCNQEQSQMPNLQNTFMPKGFRFFEAMIQGYNEQTGAAATEADLNHWATAHSLKVGIGLDPGDKIHQYADLAAFPLNMVIRTSDMQIVYMQVGLQELEPVLSGLP